MRKLPDLVGKQFGRWTVVALAQKIAGRSTWLCRCECGNEGIVRHGNLLRKSRSCGCLMREVAAATLKGNKWGIKNRRHGQSHTRAYDSWRKMIRRCTDTRDQKYPDYGARGITVCDRWSTFENFIADMGQPPTDKHTLGRIDNNGNYKPGNCRWATLEDQAHNKRNNYVITRSDGVSKNIFEWEKETGLSAKLLYGRVELNGWTADRALSTPKLRTRPTKLAISRREYLCQYVAKHKERLKEYRSFYQRVRLANSRYHGTITVEDVKYIFDRDGRKCHWCGKENLTGKDLSIDHLQPINDRDHIVVSCLRCNVGKRHRSVTGGGSA